MPTQKFERAGSLTTMWSSSSSVASGAAVFSTTEYDNANTDNLYFWADFELVLTFGTAPTAGRTFELYIIPAIDGSTYPDVDTSTPFLPPNLLAGAFVVRGVTSEQRLVLRGVTIPPSKFRIAVRNNTNQATSATTHQIQMLPYRTQSV